MVYVAIILGIFALDYNLKNYVNSNRLQGSSEEYLGGRFVLKNYHNSQGGFGIFKKNEKLGIRVCGIAMICTIWEFLRTCMQKGYAPVKLALSLVVGGGLSNYHDRVSKGYVTDYFSIGAKNKKLRNTVFNLSDWFIFAGAFLYGISQIFYAIKKK